MLKMEGQKNKDTMFKKFKETKVFNKSKKKLGRFLAIFSIILTIADMVSDIVLAVDYCVTENPWWCGLTWTFITVPVLAGIPYLCVCAFSTGEEKWQISKSWKITETCFEAAPQLILQLYIIALSGKDPSSTSGRSVNLPNLGNLIQKACKH